MNKRGSVKDLIIIAVTILILGLTGITSHYLWTQVKSGFESNVIINTSQVTLDALNDANTQINRLDYMIFGFYMSLIIAFLIVSYLIPTAPIFVLVYYLAGFIFTILSIIFAYAWYKVSSNAVFVTSLAQFPITDYILSNLHIHVVVLMFIGSLLLYGKPQARNPRIF